MRVVHVDQDSLQVVILATAAGKCSENPDARFLVEGNTAPAIGNILCLRGTKPHVERTDSGGVMLLDGYRGRVDV